MNYETISVKPLAGAPGAEAINDYHGRRRVMGQLPVGAEAVV